MGKCIHHPDQESAFICMKYQIYLCEVCLTCRDPELYCKFRESCPIWFIAKEAKRRKRREAEEAA